MSAAILEKRGTHSIHGACVEVAGKGVIIIAPKGTGKTTQAFKLLMRPDGRIAGDDWVYIRFPKRTNRKMPLIGTQSEKSLYMRTENEADQP